MYENLIHQLRNTPSRSKRKMLDEAADKLEQLTTILESKDTTQTGKWVFDGENHFCNRCNHNALCDRMTGEEVLSNNCPHCGIRMLEKNKACIT